MTALQWSDQETFDLMVTSEALAAAIDREGLWSEGRLETVEAKLQKLTALVCGMTDLLREDHQRRLVEAHTYNLKEST